jgi:hypothetical protein
MWNGPTWPHANSIVLTAMAKTIREHRDAGRVCPIDRSHFWRLFESFTMAQYRRQALEQPITGEYYHGETAEWKTAERDYFHSTWLDVLIPDVVGLNPRNDGVLDVDPLWPTDRFRWLRLDGQRYQDRDVTVIWDDPASPIDRFDDGRKGFDVYLDGALVASSPKLERLTVPLSKLIQSRSVKTGSEPGAMTTPR